MFEKAVRKIGPNNRSVTGKQVSRKSSVSQHFESSLERDYLLLLEYDAEVLRFTAHPVTITYYIKEQRRRYTPDVAVYYIPQSLRKPQLVEIKYQADLIANKDEYEAKFAAAKDYCSLCGYEFVVLTEDEIRTDKLHNIRFFSRYSGQQQDVALNKIILNAFIHKPQITPKQLLSDVPADLASQLLYALWQMVADGEILYELTKKVTMESPLWKNQ